MCCELWSSYCYCSTHGKENNDAKCKDDHVFNMDSRLNDIDSLCYLPQLQGKLWIRYVEFQTNELCCVFIDAYIVCICMRCSIIIAVIFFICCYTVFVFVFGHLYFFIGWSWSRLGTPLEKFYRKILCGEYYSLVSLLADNFSAASTLPSYRYDYMLYSHFLEGIK